MKKRSKIIIISITTLVVLVFIGAKIRRVTPLSWGHNEVNQPMFSDQAINGYDAVAYFRQNKAVPGSEVFTYKWKKANWFFSSEENKRLFVENPEIYAPEFGGFCAFAVSKGFTSNSDPNSFEIRNGKLYLFADDDIKSYWNDNLTENLQKSEENWK